MLDESRPNWIRDTARRTLGEAWRLWNDKSSDRANVLAFIHQAPTAIVRQVLNFTLETPTLLSRDDILTINPPPGFKLAGFFDRQRRRVVVVADTRRDITRFTLGHEIGHLKLHPGELVHRDRPVSGSERRCPMRDAIEIEADDFAAEILMPDRLLEREFKLRFGSNFDGRTLGPPSSLITSGIVLPNGRALNPFQFVSRGRDYRAFIAATAVGFHCRFFLSLASEFQVSPTAMAIRLARLNLVL